MDQSSIRDRLEALKRQATEFSLSHFHPDAETESRIHELFQGTLNLATILYGPDDLRIRPLADLARRSANESPHPKRLLNVARAALATMSAELDGGLLGSLRAHLTGEVLTDLLSLARDALKDALDPSAFQVAAVLAAASFEGTLRHMAEDLAGVTGRPKLAALVDELRKAKVLEGAAFRTAQNNLAFRNDALHGDWAKLDRATVESVIAFVEGLLLKHFS